MRLLPPIPPIQSSPYPCLSWPQPCLSHISSFVTLVFIPSSQCLSLPFTLLPHPSPPRNGISLWSSGSHVSRGWVSYMRDMWVYLCATSVHKGTLSVCACLACICIRTGSVCIQSLRVLYVHSRTNVVSLCTRVHCKHIIR